jgi:putative phosphoribosyl transferase
MGLLVEDKALRDKVKVFRDREEAGRKLGEKLKPYLRGDGLILAIPSGGVPVAEEIALMISLPLDLMIVRKLQIPFEPEAGFGALGPEGEVIFNDNLLKRLRLSAQAVEETIGRTLDVIRERNRLFRAGREFPHIAGRTIILVDDGLASGYTMLAAVRSLKEKSAAKIVVAVPTGSASSVQMLLSEVDELVCLNVRTGYSFAVAHAYRFWHDVTDDEVLSSLARSRSRPGV